MTPAQHNERFQRIALQHLDAAYNLAKWLTRDAEDAEDVVQESFIKAWRHFDGFRGEDGRAWLLTIVRNTSYSWLAAKKSHNFAVFDSELGHDQLQSVFSTAKPADPEQQALQKLDSEMIDQAILGLPLEFREALVLRELEGFSYQQIADIANIPIGTVMSRLARARSMLRGQLSVHFSEESA